MFKIGDFVFDFDEFVFDFDKFVFEFHEFDIEILVIHLKKYILNSQFIAS